MTITFTHSFRSARLTRSRTRKEYYRSRKISGLTRSALTDHYWDETVSKEGDVGYFADTMYTVQNTEYIKQALPLPQSDKVKFYFGAEIDMDKHFRIGVGEKMLNELDFVVIPTTHLHMDGFTIDEKDKTREGRARLFVKRFEKLLEAKLPFHKIGLAHITCSLIAPSWEEHLKVIELIDDKTFSDLFSESAKIGLGIELNAEVAKYVYNDDKEGLRRTSSRRTRAVSSTWGRMRTITTNF